MKSDGVSDNGLHEEKSQNSRSGSQTLKNEGKKIDVFKGGVKVASVGGAGYKDYPTYMKLEAQGKVPKGTANKRRRLYKNQTQKG